MMSESEVNVRCPRRLEMPWRQLAEDRAMLLDLDSGEYYELRGAAPLIWSLLDGETDLEEIAGRVACAYQVDQQQVATDLEQFFADLQQKSLLVRLAAKGVNTNDPSMEAAGGARTLAYEAPQVASKGNLKFLGQLD